MQHAVEEGEYLQLGEDGEMGTSKRRMSRRTKLMLIVGGSVVLIAVLITVIVVATSGSSSSHHDSGTCKEGEANCQCKDGVCNCVAGYAGDGTVCFAPPHPSQPMCMKTNPHCSECNGPACNCETGYVGDGTKCLAPPHPDQPLCKKDKPHCTDCKEDACNCETGYVGDGTLCYAPPHPDQPMCVKTNPHCSECSGPACNCEAGYIGDGTLCYAPPHPDQPLCTKGNAHCTDCDGPACNCATGYVSDGTSCFAPPHPDQPLCEKTKPHCTVCDGPACNCEAGYVGDGTFCLAPPHPDQPLCKKGNAHCTVCAEDACNCETGFVGDGISCFAPPHPDQPMCHKMNPHCTDCNGPACNCATGYVGNGTVCDAPPFDDIPMCEFGQPECTACNGKACNCEGGYIGNGTSCNLEVFAQSVLSMTKVSEDSCGTTWREYSCGGWMEKTPIPPDGCENTYTCELVEMFDSLQKLVNEEMAAATTLPGPCKVLYDMCMDNDTIAKEGMAQVRLLLKDVEAATTKWELVKVGAALSFVPFHHLEMNMITMGMVDPKTGELIENMTNALPVINQGGLFQYQDDDWELNNNETAVPYIEQALDAMEIDGDHHSLAEEIFNLLTTQPTAKAPETPTTWYTVAELQAVLDEHGLGEWKWSEVFTQLRYNPALPYFGVIVGNLSDWYHAVEFYYAAPLATLKAYTAFMMYGQASAAMPELIPQPPYSSSIAVKVTLEEEVFEIMDRSREGLLSRQAMQQELMTTLSRRMNKAHHGLARLRVKQRWTALNAKFHLNSMNPKPLPKHITNVQDFLEHVAAVGDGNRADFCQDVVNSVGLLDRSFLEAAKWGQESKDRALDMMHAVKKALKGHIEEMTWMDNTTKTAALKKLEYLQLNPGFPDNMSDPSQGVNMTRGYLSAVADIASNHIAHFMSHIGVFPDFKFWMWSSGFITPTTVNAMYAPMFNTITVPAAILQMKVFGGTNPAAMNFGAAGAIIGHELTHGFDNTGKNYDEYGRQRNWWTPASETEFDTRANCLADQYSSYTCCTPTVNMTGQFCLGENIADNGGIRSSFVAMKELIADHPEQHNPGHSSLEVEWTDEELFFVSWAQCWCSVYNPKGESAFISAHEDVHSPGFIRTFAPLRNMVEFSQVHGCTSGDFMDPDDRCVLF